MNIRRIAVIAVALLVLSVFSVRADDVAGTETSDPFPELAALEPNVDFWTRVFAEWTMGQVAIHDLEYPAIVYEVIDLPGPIGEGYSDAQRDWVDALRGNWEDYLLTLQGKVAHDKPLDDIDKQWVLYFATVVGADKLEGAHERVRTQRGLRERFRGGLERSMRFDGLIRMILRQNGLPEDLAYLPHVESSFQYHARSTAGAAGMWQFTRGTGKRYMTINSAIDERLDPIAASHGAAGYLKNAYEKLGSWPLALTSYNHGVEGMRRAKNRFGTDFEKIFREYDGRLFGFASKNFYAEFLAARRVARDSDRYFPEGYTPEAEFDLDSVVLEHRVTPYWISTHYQVPLDELATINPAWSSRAVKNALRLPIGTAVWLPEGTLDALEASGGAIQPPALPADGAAYVVRHGDTLSSIAAEHAMGLSQLRQLNGMAPASSLIRPGQTLRVGAPAVSGPHVVRRGETLSEIAREYGVTLGSLRAANGMSSRSSLIHAGQQLQVPVTSLRAAELEHVVRRGETLERIATRHRVRLADLLTANTLTMKSIIHPGQILRIP